jgi:hypothetical protein
VRAAPPGEDRADRAGAPGPHRRQLPGVDVPRPGAPLDARAPGLGRDDYRRHVDDYDRAGVDLRALPIVGIGSVCRRQATARSCRWCARWRGPASGCTASGSRCSGCGRSRAIASADSMAWSFEARRQPVLLPGCTSHINCANCCAGRCCGATACWTRHPSSHRRISSISSEVPHDRPDPTPRRGPGARRGARCRTWPGRRRNVGARVAAGRS